MTTIPSSLFASRSGTQVSDLYASATKSLMAQNPALKTIDAQLRRDEARLSNLGKIALALDGFGAAAGKLSAGALDMAASVGGKGGNGLGVRLSAGAAPAVHTVEVTQLAQAQQLTSRALADKNAPLGAGGVSLIRIESGQGSGASTTTVRIAPGSNSLEGIAAAMREAGLDAEVVQDGKGYALSLSGKPGAANAMRISVAGDPALQGLLSWQSGSGGMRQQLAAQDAQLTVDGKRIASPGNTVAGAIPGVTLTLVAAGKHEVTVTRAPSAIAQNVKGVVEAFNVMQAGLETLEGGDADAQAVLRQVEGQIAAAFGDGDRQALADMGLTFRGGKLELDEAKLKTAIAADGERVAQLFSNGKDGVADRLATAVARQFASGSALHAQADAIEQDMDRLADKRSQLTEAASRQAMVLMQQYQMAGSGGSSLFGMLQGPPMSAFDFMA
ncbi:MAG: flagellar filament capping protein FliD [Janthinobacterium lividum]